MAIQSRVYSLPVTEKTEKRQTTTLRFSDGPTSPRDHTSLRLTRSKGISYDGTPLEPNREAARAIWQAYGKQLEEERAVDIEIVEGGSIVAKAEVIRSPQHSAAIYWRTPEDEITAVGFVLAWHELADRRCVQAGLDVAMGEADDLSDNDVRASQLAMLPSLTLSIVARPRPLMQVVALSEIHRDDLLCALQMVVLYSLQKLRFLAKRTSEQKLFERTIKDLYILSHDRRRIEWNFLATTAFVPWDNPVQLNTYCTDYLGLMADLIHLRQDMEPSLWNSCDPSCDAWRYYFAAASSAADAIAGVLVRAADDKHIDSMPFAAYHQSIAHEESYRPQSRSPLVAVDQPYITAWIQRLSYHVGHAIRRRAPHIDASIADALAQPPQSLMLESSNQRSPSSREATIKSRVPVLMKSIAAEIGCSKTTKAAVIAHITKEWGEVKEGAFEPHGNNQLGFYIHWKLLPREVANILKHLEPRRDRHRGRADKPSTKLG